MRAEFGIGASLRREWGIYRPRDFRRITAVVEFLYQVRREVG